MTLSFRRGARAMLAVLALVVLGACAQAGPGARGDAPGAVPKNIIILFGDGAAATQWELGRYTSRVLRDRPFAVTDVVFRQGTLGLLTTYSANSPVTDPAALATAAGPRLLGLFAVEDMDFEIDRDPKQEPSAADMAAALRVLSASNPKGFVLFVENENLDSAGHRNDAAALIRDLWAFDDAVQVALDFQRRTPAETLVIVTGDHETGGLSWTNALKDLTSMSSSNRFYPDKSHLEMVSRISISLQKATALLGTKPTPERLDHVIAENFPGFRLDADLREAILAGRTIERNVTYLPHGVLGRMVARQTGVYWGTTGHTTQPVVVGAMGPGEGAFRGYLDNTDFAKALHRLIDGR